MKTLKILVLICAIPGLARGEVEEFIESFNGDGPYASLNNQLVGFDNPGWEVYSDDGFANGGFHIQNDGGILFEDRDVLERTSSGVGSFVTRIELRDLDLSDFDDDRGHDSWASIGLLQRLHYEDVDEGRNVIYFNLRKSFSPDPTFWTLSTRSSSSLLVNDVPRGPLVAIEIIFDHDASEVSFTYDHDTSDEIAPLRFGPLAFEGTMQDTQLMTLVSSSGSLGYVDGILDDLSVTPFSSFPGDFDGDGILDAGDMDLLSTEVRAGTNDLAFDLNDDSLVNELDRTAWVHDLKQTYFGDADLNGEFASTDLVQVLATGEYEDDVALNSTWLTGDWDGDGEFTSTDLIEALADGGYENGPRAAVAAVPEPSGLVLLVLGALGLVARRRAGAKG